MAKRVRDTLWIKQCFFYGATIFPLGLFFLQKHLEPVMFHSWSPYDRYHLGKEIVFQGDFLDAPISTSSIYIHTNGEEFFILEKSGAMKTRCFVIMSDLEL